MKLFFTLLLFLPFLSSGQTIQCNMNGKKVMLNENYIHFDNKPLIRIHLICNDVDHCNDIVNYEWHSKLYRYVFEWENSSSLLFIAYDPKTNLEVQIWQVNNYKMTLIQNNNLVNR